MPRTEHTSPVGFWVVVAVALATAGCVVPGSGEIGPTQNFRRLGATMAAGRVATCDEPRTPPKRTDDDELPVMQMDCRGRFGVRIRVVRWKSYSLETTGLGKGLRFTCSGRLGVQPYVDGGGWAAAPLGSAALPPARVRRAMDQFAVASRGDLRTITCS